MEKLEWNGALCKSQNISQKSYPKSHLAFSMDIPSDDVRVTSLTVINEHRQKDQRDILHPREVG